MKATLVLVVITSLMTVLRAVDTTNPFDVTTILGEKFKDCRIIKVTPEGLTLMHDRGVARVSFDVLDEELKKQFNYDPEKARAYAQAEEERRKAAEALRAELMRKRQLNEDAQLAELAAAERQRLEAEAKAVKEYQESVKAANTPPIPLAPLPGDATPNLGVPAPQPIMQTEVVVPELTPVGDPYTPTRIRSRSYIYPGYGYGYGYPYGGFYQPIYGYPGCGHHVSPCPPSSSILGIGSISTGSTQMWIRR